MSAERILSFSTVFAGLSGLQAPPGSFQMQPPPEKLSILQEGALLGSDASAEATALKSLTCLLSTLNLTAGNEPSSITSTDSVCLKDSPLSLGDLSKVIQELSLSKFKQLLLQFSGTPYGEDLEKTRHIVAAFVVEDKRMASPPAVTATAAPPVGAPATAAAEQAVLTAVGDGQYTLSVVKVQSASGLARLQLISVASGSKMITGEFLTMNGDTLIDSHAEVIARRGLLRYLLQELLEYKKKTPTTRVKVDYGDISSEQAKKDEKPSDENQSTPQVETVSSGTKEKPEPSTPAGSKKSEQQRSPKGEHAKSNGKKIEEKTEGKPAQEAEATVSNDSSSEVHEKSPEESLSQQQEAPTSIFELGSNGLLRLASGN